MRADSLRSAAPRLPRLHPALLLILTLALALAAGFGAALAPLLLLALLALLILVPALVRWPSTGTPLAVFLLYSNLIVVGTKFHGVPVFAGALVPGLLALSLAAALILRRERLVWHPVLILVAAFFLVQLLGAVFARYTRVALVEIVTFVLEGVLLYLLVLNVVRTEVALRRATWALLIAAIFLAALPLVQMATNTYDNNYWGLAQLSEAGFRTGEELLQGEVRQFRSGGAIGEQNRYAQIMLMVFPLALFLFWSEHAGWLRGLALLAVAMSLAGVALSFSRGAAVAFVLLLLAMVALRVIRPYQFGLVLLAGLLVLVALPQYRTRLATLPEVTAWLGAEEAGAAPDSSAEGRTTEMLAAALVFADHPLLGVGPGMFKYYSQEYGNRLGIHHLEETREAHSLYLDIAANHGLAGLIVFFGIFFVTMRELLRGRRLLLDRNRRLAALCGGYVLALTSYLATGLFLHLAYDRYLWLMLGLAAATAIIARREAGLPPAGGVA